MTRKSLTANQYGRVRAHSLFEAIWNGVQAPVLREFCLAPAMRRFVSWG